MTIIAKCDACNQTYNVGDDKAGKKFRCKKCDQLVQVPFLEEEAEDWEIVEDEPAQSENWYAGNVAAPRPKTKGKKNPYAARSGPTENGVLGVNWYLEGWKNAVNFGGRARRKEYWMFAAGNALILIALTVIEYFTLGVQLEEGDGAISAGIFNLFAIVPNISLTFRRLHDIGKSAWWLLILFIPLVGGLVMLYFMVKDSEPGTNQWGPSPKYS